MSLTPHALISAYTQGAFPMRDDSGGPDDVAFYQPRVRAILPLDDRFRIRRSLAKRVRNAGFDVRRDTAFEDVIRACARPRLDRHGQPTEGGGVWINRPIRRAFCHMHRLGFAHSVETWRGDRLVGGLYGLALGGAFFGESMFSRESDASQVALVHLVEHLRDRGFLLLDTQFNNHHINQFGVEEVPHRVYMQRLDIALAADVTW